MLIQTKTEMILNTGISLSLKPLRPRRIQRALAQAAQQRMKSLVITLPLTASLHHIALVSGRVCLSIYSTTPVH